MLVGFLVAYIQLSRQSKFINVKNSTLVKDSLEIVFSLQKKVLSLHHESYNKH